MVEIIIGRYYKNRKGIKRGPMRGSPTDLGGAVFSDNVFTYRANGDWAGGSGKDQFDLIS